MYLGYLTDAPPSPPTPTFWDKVSDVWLMIVVLGIVFAIVWLLISVRNQG